MFSAGLSINVIDPMNRTGKVAIPAHLVQETKGLEDYRQAAKRQENKDFSLCLLFQKGKCNAGARCHQVHASADFVRELRERAAAAKNCCADHGDVHSHGYMSDKQTIRITNVSEEKTSSTLYHLSSFGRTACLDNLLRNVRSMELTVPDTRLCRLHSQRRCKFGKDCKNIHLCPDAIAIRPASEKVVMGCPSIDLSCGISNRSVSSSSSSVPSSSKGTTPNDTPRITAAATSTVVVPPLQGFASVVPTAVSAPLSVDVEDIVVVKSLGITNTINHNGSSFFLSTHDENEDTTATWGARSCYDDEGDDELLTSVRLDMSAFETTMRSLCCDLDRVESSPGCARRVESFRSLHLAA